VRTISYQSFIGERTPLHIAANNNSVEIGELFIRKGADINAKDIIFSKYCNIVFQENNFKEIKEIKS